MKYIIISFIFLFFIFCAAGLFVVLYATTRRDRTDLFKPSTVAPSARVQFRNAVEKGVEWFEAQFFEKLTIVSQDGLTLQAELLSPTSPKACMIAMHGFRSWPSREFAAVSKLLYENNIAVLYPYQRAHRLSNGKYITFGVKEKYDCAKWAFLLSTRFPNLPLFLYGQSMGGATVLMTGSIPMPIQLKGVIADSAYDSPSDVMISLFKRTYHVPGYPLILFVDLWTLLLAHYELFRHKASKSMRQDLSYLFIHGDCDELIPIHMGLNNYINCPSLRKTLLTVPGAGHCACCYKQQAEYINTFLRFINENL